MEFNQLSSLTKTDLHIHTKESSYKDGELVEDGDLEHLPTLLEALNKNQVNLFAFADHNRFNPDYVNRTLSILNSQEGKKKYPYVKNVLSAVEFDVTIDENRPSCHILTVFDAQDEADREKIHKEIENRKLTKENEAYRIEIFAKLLSEICLPTILIACQRKDLHNPNGRSNSISDSCDDVNAFLQTGYISALEYQKPNVEGILQNCLKDFPDSVKPCLLANSDCHQWAYYPSHDKNSTNVTEKSWCFTMFAQPSFLGLLMTVTSPSTRLKRFPASAPYIESFTFGGQTYPLSPGFNAIIGENGSGKSSLLSILSNPRNNLERHIQRIKDEYSITTRYSNPPPVLHYIKQAELVERSHNDEKNNNLFGTDAPFPEPDHSLFRKDVKTFTEAIKRSIKTRIAWKTSQNNLSSQSFEVKPELEGSSTYYTSIICDPSFSTTENPNKDRLIALNNVLDAIASEYRQKEYTPEQKQSLLSAYQIISKVRAQIAKKYEETEYLNGIRSAIVECATSYNNSIREKESTHDTEIKNYRQRRVSFINAVLKVIRLQNENAAIVIPKLQAKYKSSKTSKNGFDFICTPQYVEIERLEDEILKHIFNSHYRSIDAIKSIDSDAAFSEAVTRSEGDGSKRFDDLVSSFRKKAETTTKTILIHDTKDAAGGTMGEQALSYYRYITNTESGYQTILIDQPEDNISVPSILRKLISYFNVLRDQKQIIFVTHNPLLVINMDADNVVWLGKKNGKISCVSGCLEKNGILERVEECLDGGKDALKKRLNVYE